MSAERTADHPIDPLFINRWSPRAYEAASMPEADLLTILEAARWAPSAFNIQPWRFLYSQRGEAHWQTYLELLDPFNASWAQHASALVFVLSDTFVSGDGNRPDKPSRTPAVTAVVSAFLLKEKLAGAAKIALMFGIIGAVWVVFRGDPAALMALDLGMGDGIFLAGTIAFGIFGPLVKYLHRD